MALITTSTPSVAGTAPSFTAAASGDTARCGSGYWLVAKNTNVASRTVTVVVPGNLATGDAYPDKVYTLAADTGEVWVPLLREYADPSDGLAHLTWSATAGVTRAVVKF
jgi:hypothetical protein